MAWDLAKVKGKGRRIRHFAVRLMTDENGPSAIEFALLSAILLPILLGLTDYGLAQFKKIELSGAVRSGAQYILLNDYDSATVETVVTSATNIPSGDVTVSSSEFCECADGTSISDCSDSCDDGESVQKFVTVSATYDFTPIILPTTITVSESATIRTQ